MLKNSAVPGWRTLQVSSGTVLFDDLVVARISPQTSPWYKRLLGLTPSSGDRIVGLTPAPRTDEERSMTTPDSARKFLVSVLGFIRERKLLVAAIAVVLGIGLSWLIHLPTGYLRSRPPLRRPSPPISPPGSPSPGR